MSVNIYDSANDTLIPVAGATLYADTGSGVPVGTIIGQYKKVNMSGYLYLDGSTFDETLYPALYAYLGTNVLPDYREFVLVGAEQNSTSATIATHDVFTQGEEKDDQIQEHQHKMYFERPGSGQYSGITDIAGTILVDYGVSVAGARSGTTTRTKEKAVFWYIKATTGIIESEATEVLNLYNEQNSYSTSEINTGKKWIDGKPIYRKVISLLNGTGTQLRTLYNLSDYGIASADTIYIANPSFYSNGAKTYPFSFYDGNRFSAEVDRTQLAIILENTEICVSKVVVTLEYTKTTD